jgi:hypothetical protein
MTAIAVLAALCFGAILSRRSTGFRRLSASYARLEKDCWFRAAVADEGVRFSKERIREEEDLPRWKEQLQWWSDQSVREKDLAQQYHDISLKFKDAAAHPWAYVPYRRAAPSPEPLLPPPDLPLRFTVDPKTGKKSP